MAMSSCRPDAPPDGARSRRHRCTCTSSGVRAGERGFARETARRRCDWHARAARRVGRVRRPLRRIVASRWRRSTTAPSASSLSCIKPTHDATPILHEGGIYLGCWLESTGTINAEIAVALHAVGCRPRPTAAFAAHQRDDGLLPYKLTADGPGFNQIQIVTPLARCVWNHYRLNGRDRTFLRTMYDAMARYDAWLAKYRDTRGTGGVEAFCAYDTGHDLSSRFWHVPDTPVRERRPRVQPRQSAPAASSRPTSPPTSPASAATSREIAEELGEDGEVWRDKADTQHRGAVRASASTRTTASSTTATPRPLRPRPVRRPAPRPRLRDRRRCLLRRGARAATCSTRGNSSRNTRSPRSRWTIRASSRRTTTTPGTAPRTRCR